MIASCSSSVLRVASRGSGTRSLLARTYAVKASADASELKAEVPSSGDEKFEVNLHEGSFTGHRIDTPTLDVHVSKNQLVWMYSQMVKMRRMEMAADALYKQKLIRGAQTKWFCHLAIGQEAVAVGMESAMKPDDKLITAYRFAVMRGGTIKGVIAELLGRVDGMSHGKGGSMHIFTKSFFGGNGIVGAQVPIGAGIAFAQQYLGQEKEHATFALYGDGASNQGQVFEAYNMAALWKLPCVFVCENNQYARSSSNTRYFTRGDVIPGLQVNAMDVLAVHKAVQFSKEYTAAGNGPLLLEMVTYRYGGHSMSDPGTTYRTREEIQHMRSSSDPITGLKNRLIDWKVVEESELKEIDKSARQEVDKAVEEAKNSPEPDLAKDMWTDVYFEGSAPTYLRGREREEIHWYSKDQTSGAPKELPSLPQLGSNKETDEIGRLRK